MSVGTMKNGEYSALTDGVDLSAGLRCKGIRHNREKKLNMLLPSNEQANAEEVGWLV